MQADIKDTDFVEQMTHLLDIDKDAVEALLDKLSADDLMSLSDAVANGDEAAARDVIGALESDEEVNPLFRGADIDAGQTKKVHKQRKKGSVGVGDEVIVDGEDGAIEATLIKTDGPKDTVMVKYQGKKHMVDRHKVHLVKKIEEMVIGMTRMPELQRIQRLAGIAADPSMMAFASSVAQPAPEMAVQGDTESLDLDGMNPAACAEQALDRLEEVLPQITLGDLKAIRQRIVAIQAKMNEGYDVRKWKL